MTASQAVFPDFSIRYMLESKKAASPIGIEQVGKNESMMVDQHRQATANGDRQATVARVAGHCDQAIEALPPDRSDDPELGEMSADRIADLGPLTGQDRPRAMQHQHALLLRRLHADEAPFDCLPGRRSEEPLSGA